MSLIQTREIVPSTIVKPSLVARAAMAGRQLLGNYKVVQPKKTATIAAIVPCYNEESSIEQVLKSILGQSRPPEAIYVIANNCEDQTVDVANKFSGVHRRSIKGLDYSTVVSVHDMGENPDKKVGALNYGYGLASWADFLLGVDGDTILERNCVKELELEMASDTRIGGISAIYDIMYQKGAGPMANYLIAGQRKQFAEFQMDNLMTSGRKASVLGGQASLFRVSALDSMCSKYHISAPWVRDSAVEDGLLTLWLSRAGFKTLFSATARAHVDPMTTMSALHHQQVKWVSGGADLMLKYPFHKNLKLRWTETFGMLTNILTRVFFVSLVVAAVSLGVFTFLPIYLIPPAVAILLNLRVATSMKTRCWKDYLFGIMFIPAEVYTWIRAIHFVSSWGKVLSKSNKDAWAAQAKAESGAGGSLASVWPIIVVGMLVGAAAYGWTQLGLSTQLQTIHYGWNTLLVITAVQTLFMARKVLRRNAHGYKV